MSYNIQIVQSAYEAFARGDIETMLGSLAPTFEWREPDGSLYAGVYRTREELVEKLLMRLGADFELTMTPDEIVEVGSTVIVRGRYEGTHRRTGKKATCRYVSFNEFEDGKLARYEHFFDTALYQSAAA
jgi:ketosteroid isomerase-like protein